MSADRSATMMLPSGVPCDPTRALFWSADAAMARDIGIATQLAAATNPALPRVVFGVGSPLPPTNASFLAVKALPRPLACDRTYTTALHIPADDALTLLMANSTTKSRRPDLTPHIPANNGRFYVFQILADAGVAVAMYLDVDAVAIGRLAPAFEVLEAAVPSALFGVVYDPTRALFGPYETSARAKSLGYAGSSKCFNAGVFAVRTGTAAAMDVPRVMGNLLRDHMDPRVGPLWGPSSVNQAAFVLATSGKTTGLPFHFNCRILAGYGSMDLKITRTCRSKVSILHGHGTLPMVYTRWHSKPWESVASALVGVATSSSPHMPSSLSSAAGRRRRSRLDLHPGPNKHDYTGLVFIIPGRIRTGALYHRGVYAAHLTGSAVCDCSDTSCHEQYETVVHVGR